VLPQIWENAFHTQKMVTQLEKTFYEQKIRFLKLEKRFLHVKNGFQTLGNAF
jgi:N-dimethylarginine dimethylaminohydrolase